MGKMTRKLWLLLAVFTLFAMAIAVLGGGFTGGVSFTISLEVFLFSIFAASYSEK